jgi:putative membrane protein
MIDPPQLRAAGADASSRLALDRTRLAYERTMLSWVRTATALITFGFAIYNFHSIANASGQQSFRLLGPHGFGLSMGGIGLLALLMATLEHRSAIRDLRAQYPLEHHYPYMPRSRARVLAALIALLGLMAFFIMIFRQ